MEATNLSKIKRNEMIGFLEHLKQKNNDDKSIRAINEIINQLNNTKYGLVWEHHQERVDIELTNNIPIFTEVKEKHICNDSNDYNFLMLCNDFIVDILKCTDKYQWSSEKIDIKEKDIKKFNSSKYDIFYFREHGYATVINRSLYKHIVFSLVADYNTYVFDAINCALRYHFGTAFTLLRKPFKDDLLLLEMIYVKGYRFVPEFLNKPIKNFSIDKITKEEKKKILRKCCKKINFFTGKRMYDLRYEKSSKESLEKIWNKTSHIITNAKDYATEDGNLNIIFATEDIVEENLVYFYKVCCSVQLYFVTLLLNILKDQTYKQSYHLTKDILYYFLLYLYF